MPIRPAELRDARAIAEVQVASWQSAYRGLLPDHLLDGLSVEDRAGRWRERLAEEGSQALVIEEEGRILGFAILGASQDEDATERTGEVYAIYLAPSEWRKGYGSGLMSEAIARLREQRFAEVAVWVLQGNLRAIRFYEKHGFAADGATKVRMRAGSPSPEMRLRRPI